MTKTKIFEFTILVLFIGFLSSCCNEKDENSGSIISNFSIDNFNEYNYFHCFDLYDTICIRNDSVYKKIFSLKDQKTECTSIILPKIDFSKNSILIYYVNSGGRTYFHRHVEIDTLNKLVTYTIATVGCFCPDKCISSSYNIVIVPRIKDNFKVEYK
jgi:hypothetical protein